LFCKKLTKTQVVKNLKKTQVVFVKNKNTSFVKNLKLSKTELFL